VTVVTRSRVNPPGPKVVDAAVADVSPVRVAVLQQADGAGCAGLLLERHAVAELDDAVVRERERERQEALRVEDRQRQLREGFLERRYGDLRRARAVCMAAHAVDDDHERRELGDKHADAVLILEPIARQAQFCRVESHTRYLPSKALMGTLTWSSSDGPAAESTVVNSPNRAKAPRLSETRRGLNRMPHSMTGFASAEALSAPFRVAWEVRSVNHRFLDVSLRMPEELRPLEGECRDLVGATLKRGKVDLTLKMSTQGQGELPGKLVPQALDALRALAAEANRAFPDAEPLGVADVLRWPGVLETPRPSLEGLAAPVREALTAALRALVDSRRREGERLAQRTAAIKALVADLRPLLDGAAGRYRERLRERLVRLDVQADPARLEQEIALVAQRADVAEEIDRLSGHVVEIEDVLRRDEPIGRRLDFVIQELNREANTFASKVQEEALTRGAVELKVLIEQMREQVQNLE
jgi:uncharacterized protein (TIGR00255 family)